MVARIDVIAKVYDKDGKLIKEEIQKGKLPTATFVRLFGRYVAGPKSTGNYFTAIDEAANTYTLITGTGSSTSAFYYTGDGRVKIAIGTGTTPPSRSDYRLENKIAEVSLSAPYITQIEAPDYSSITVYYIASFNFTSDTTITECGLFYLLRTALASDNWFLMDRSSLNVTVPAGGGLAIQFVITFQA